MLRKLRKVLFYLAATLLLLVALGVGVMRLAMPQLPEYRDEIQARLAEQIQGEVTFERIDARWRWRGPEILLDNVVIGPTIGSQTIEPLSVDSVVVGVSFSALALRREVVIRHVELSGVVISLGRQAEGWSLQGVLLASEEDAMPLEAPAVTLDSLPIATKSALRIRDVSVVYSDQLTERAPMVFELKRSRVQVSPRQIEVSALLQRPDGSDSEVDLFATGRYEAFTVDGLLAGQWRAHADLDRFSADIAHAFLPTAWRLPQDGLATVSVDVDWDAGSLLAASLVFDAATLIPPDGGDESSVAGRAELTRTDDGWLCAIDEFVVGVASRRWPAASLRLDLSESAETSTAQFDVANITVYDLPYLASFMPEAVALTVLNSRLSGTIVSGDGFLEFARGDDGLTGVPGALEDYEVNLDYEGLSVASLYGLPGFGNLTGTLRMTDKTGSLTLDSTAATASIPGLFAEDVQIDTLAGTLIWRDTDQGIEVVSDAINMRAQSVDLQGTVQMNIGGESGIDSVDVDAQWSVGDVRDAKALLPVGVMHPKLVGWLRGALQSGRIDDGKLRLAGDLSEFPFRDGGGEFRLSGEATQMTLEYARQWPALTDVDATIELDGLSLATRRNRGRSGQVPFSNVFVRFDDLLSGVLLIDSQGREPLTVLANYVGDSPIAALLGGQTERMQFGGNAAYDVSLKIPLKQIRQFEFEAELLTDDGEMQLDYLPFGLSAIDGRVRFDRKGAYASGVTARLLGGQATLAVSPAADQSGLILEADGVATASELVDRFGLPLEDRIDGQAAFRATLRLPKAQRPGSPAPSDPKPIRLTVMSDLEAMTLDLPYPIGKTAEQIMPVALDMSIDRETLVARASLPPNVDVLAEFARIDSQPLRFDRATLHLGEGEALRSSVPGLFVDGRIDRLRLGDWLALRGDNPSGLVDLLQSVAVEVDDLYAFGQRVRDVGGTLQRSGESWLIDVQGPSVSGTVSLPLPLGGPRPVVLDMQRLALLEADPEASGVADPSRLPALRIKVASFALGEREFGVLEAQLDQVENGLEASSLATASDAFTMSATGSWLLDPGNTQGSATALKGSVRSSDVKRMMAQLGYAPGIGAELLDATFDVSWDGGPSPQFLESLDGDARLKIADGSLDEVDPGAGRVVGLLSLAELPRRLSLDFSDVFRKGFTFSEIAGDFRLVNGDAFTCNLALQSTSADVGLIGRASLFKRNYNQTAIVSVKVGNTLPAVGAVVAGPQVGAALLLFSQIFKKPLQGMTEVYYQINGSWDEPSIDRTDAARFVATSDLAGCVIDVPN